MAMSTRVPNHAVAAVVVAVSEEVPGVLAVLAATRYQRVQLVQKALITVLLAQSVAASSIRRESTPTSASAIKLSSTSLRKRKKSTIRRTRRTRSRR